MKQLARLPGDQQKQILQRLRLMERHGLDAPLDIKPLRGRDGWRLRVGKNRVLFRRRDDTIIIMVIGPRGDIYKS